MNKPNRLLILFVTVVAVAMVTIFPACTPEDKRLDLESILPAGWKPYATYRLDTNADNQKDWVILYTYDRQAKDAFTPVGGVVYHVFSFVNQDKPPVVYPYPLVVPGWSHLGEGKSSIELKEVLKDSPGPELIYRGVNSDGLLTRLALFTWKNNAPSPVLPPEADPITGQWYHCLGKFSTDARIALENDRVTVWERVDARSQLALRQTYLPQNGSYLEGNDLRAPAQTCIDFAFGQPQDVARSPYPEKILMAFLTNLKNDQVISQFMTQAAMNALRNRQGDWAKITPWPRASLTDICVKELRYAPDQEIAVQQQMVIQAEKTREAQRILAATPDVCRNCPQPECTCPPTPTVEPMTEPVVVKSRVEYTLIDQVQTVYAEFQLVKVNNIWRINHVIVE